VVLYCEEYGAGSLLLVGLGFGINSRGCTVLHIITRIGLVVFDWLWNQRLPVCSLRDTSRSKGTTYLLVPVVLSSKYPLPVAYKLL